MSASGRLLRIALNCLNQAVGAFSRPKNAGRRTHSLSELDDRLLEDIGLTRSEAMAMDRKPHRGHPVQNDDTG